MVSCHTGLSLHSPKPHEAVNAVSADDLGARHRDYKQDLPCLLSLLRGMAESDTSGSPSMEPSTSQDSESASPCCGTIHLRLLPLTHWCGGQSPGLENAWRNADALGILGQLSLPIYKMSSSQWFMPVSVSRMEPPGIPEGVSGCGGD